MNIIPPDLIKVQKLVYEPHGFFLKNIVLEQESQEYGACEFEMNGKRIKFRVAKITPTKIGQFVTFWKRMQNTGPIMPYDISDPFNFLLVSVRSAAHFGHFVFPKSVLYEQGLVSKNAQGGKRAMRVYPPWDVAKNSQAKKTQAWQNRYFFEIHENGQTDFDRIAQLFKT